MPSFLNNIEIEQMYGKRKLFLRMMCMSTVSYLSGVSDFDELILSSGHPSRDMMFELRKDGFILNLLVGFGQRQVGIPASWITEFEVQDRQQLYDRKGKSVVGRALIGGLLLGPVGAIVGGMTGIKDGDKKASMPDLLVSIKYVDESETESIIVSSCKFKDRGIVETFLRTTLPHAVVFRQ